MSNLNSKVKTPNSRAEYENWHVRRAQDTRDRHDALLAPWHIFIQNHLPPLAGKKVLEIACGRGQLSSVLASRGAEVIAGDFSFQALEILKREHQHQKEIKPLAADACFLPLKENSVDILISCETIEHIKCPQLALHEFHRVLKKDGLLLLTCPSYLNSYGLYRIYLKLRGRPYNSGGIIQPIENWLFSFQIKRWLKTIGFSLISSSGVGHYRFFPGKMPKSIVPLNDDFWLNKILKVFALHSFFIAKASR